MKKFYNHIVNHRKLIITAFLIAFVVCLVCKQFVSVNYDMNDYLPEGSASTQALELMNSEYDGGIPNARVMIHDVSIAEALEAADIPYDGYNLGYDATLKSTEYTFSVTIFYR